MKKTILDFGRILFLTGILLLASCNGSVKNNGQNNSSVAEINTNPEYKGVESAILDYVEGLYQADSTRIERSVDTTLRKIGYWLNPETRTYRDNLEMTYEQLVGLAARWNKDGSRANASSPKTIDIYDINDRTASAKLTAEWGIDYFHLAKLNDKWMIMNVLWQSPPLAQKTE